MWQWQVSLEGHLQTKLRAASRWLMFFIVSEVFFHYHVCCSYTSPWFDLILNTVPTCLIVLLRRASSWWRNYNDELWGFLAAATQRKRTSFHSLIVVKLELWVYCTTTFMVNTLKNCWNWFRLSNTMTRHPNAVPPLTLFLLSSLVVEQDIIRSLSFLDQFAGGTPCLHQCFPTSTIWLSLRGMWTITLNCNTSKSNKKSIYW